MNRMISWCKLEFTILNSLKSGFLFKELKSQNWVDLPFQAIQLFLDQKNGPQSLLRWLKNWIHRHKI